MRTGDCAGCDICKWTGWGVGTHTRKAPIGDRRSQGDGLSLLDAGSAEGKGEEEFTEEEDDVDSQGRVWTKN